MKPLKTLLSLLAMFFIMASFSQCSSAHKFEKKAPFELGEVYAQKWVAGVKGGGSGINVFIPVKDTSIQLDSMFFRGQKVKIEFSKGENQMYVGRFKTEFNQSKEIVLSSNMKEESDNQLLIVKEKIPFELNNDECVISYRRGEKMLYYKISNIKTEPTINYPSAPPIDQ